MRAGIAELFDADATALGQRVIELGLEIDGEELPDQNRHDQRLDQKGIGPMVE